MAGLAFSLCMSKPLLVHCEQHLNHHLPLIVPINASLIGKRSLMINGISFTVRSRCSLCCWLWPLWLLDHRIDHFIIGGMSLFRGARTQSVHHGCFYIFPRPIQNEVHTNTNIQPFRSLLKVKINCGNLPYFVFKVLLVTYAGNYLKV